MKLLLAFCGLLALAVATFDAEANGLPVYFNTFDVFPHCSMGPGYVGKCGASNAFASAAMMTWRYCIASGQTQHPVFSPQMLVSCNTYNAGCQTGTVANDLTYTATYGIPTDQCVPWVSGNGVPTQCPTHCADGTVGTLVKTTQPMKIMGSPVNIATEIYQSGPVIAEMTVYQDFYNYPGGIYVPSTPVVAGKLNVLIVGWGNANGVNYWIAQNTAWGNQWGLNNLGVFFIAQGQNTAGIEGNVLSAKVIMN